ncbi:MAG: hypothetical protein ACRDNW_04545 [Trebonia sp.]
MVILYGVGLLLTLLIGAAIGVLVTVAHYEQTALRRWTYEKEVAEGREIYAALATIRRIKPGRPIRWSVSHGQRNGAIEGLGRN